MKKKKISLRGLAEILSERELKNVLGGSGNGEDLCVITCIYSDGSTSTHSEPYGRCTIGMYSDGICGYLIDSGTSFSCSSACFN
jgi:natural product precursor